MSEERCDWCRVLCLIAVLLLCVVVGFMAGLLLYPFVAPALKSLLRLPMPLWIGDIYVNSTHAYETVWSDFPCDARLSVVVYGRGGEPILQRRLTANLTEGFNVVTLGPLPHLIDTPCIARVTVEIGGREKVEYVLVLEEGVDEFTRLKEAFTLRLAQAFPLFIAAILVSLIDAALDPRMIPTAFLTLAVVLIFADIDLLLLGVNILYIY